MTSSATRASTVLTLMQQISSMKKYYISPFCSIISMDVQTALCQTSIQFGATNESFQPDADSESYF